jgi:hypothetical protein
MPRFCFTFPLHAARIWAKDQQLGDLLLEHRDLAEVNSARLNIRQRCFTPIEWKKRACPVGFLELNSL